MCEVLITALLSFFVIIIITIIIIIIIIIYTGSPEPRHSIETSCAGSNSDSMLFYVSSEGSSESAHLHRLTLAFTSVPKSHVLSQMAILFYSRQQ